MISFVIGITGIAITVMLHAVTTSFVAMILVRYGRRSHQKYGHWARPFILGFAATCLAIKHFMDILLWAVAYRYVGAYEELPDFESAVYFSSVTYTALGEGDSGLTNSWRIICGLEAMNGILLFGWSTALLFVVVQELWVVEPKKDSEAKAG